MLVVQLGSAGMMARITTYNFPMAGELDSFWLGWREVVEEHRCVVFPSNDGAQEEQ
jgi:hypothetical protein